LGGSVIELDIPSLGADQKKNSNASKAVKLTANAEKTHFHISLQECRTKSLYKLANKYIKKHEVKKL
jgi:hypothetical protein